MSALPPRNPLHKVTRTKPWVLDRMLKSPVGEPLQIVGPSRYPRLILGLFAVGASCLLLGACVFLVLSALKGLVPDSAAGELAPTEQATAPALETLPQATVTAPVVLTPAPSPASTGPSPSPVATAPRRPAATATPVKYQVVSGDTLLGIALKFGVTVDALKEANGLTSDMIHGGDELIIPASP